MRFTKVKIDNFYNLKEVDLDLTNRNTLIVGPNGAGKTNIIKCIQFLVHQTLKRENKETDWLLSLGEMDHPEMYDLTYLPQEHHKQKIWNPNEKDCHIELHAQFNKAEMELFSELRVLSLMADVCYVVYIVTALLMGEAADHERQFYKDHGLKDYKRDPGELKEMFINSLLEDKEGIFSDLPEATLRNIIDQPYPERTCHAQLSDISESDERRSLSTPCVAQLVMEVTNNLFPELLKITKRALSEWQDTPCPVEAPSHVLMRAQTNETSSRMKYSFDVFNDDGLPTKHPKYKKEECKVICSTLQNVFGEMRNIKISFCKKLAPVSSLYEAVKILPKLNFERFDIRPKVRGVSTSKFGRPPWAVSELVDKLHGKVQYTPWGDLFSRCLAKLQLRDWRNVLYFNKKTFFHYAATRFLESSTINCILPQVRGIAMENDDMPFTINSLEKQLISCKLNKDEVMQQQFSKVKDGMTSFCGIKIHVLQRKEALVQDNDEEAKKIEELGDELRGKDRVGLLEYGYRLSCIGREMMRKAPSWSGDLHVMVTRTQRNETSTYSHRTPLCGLSGGEVEILMVLCTIHLSGAETVFLDEPGHSLHPPQQAQLCRWIETLQYPDPVCVVITHSVEFISRKSLCSLYHMSFTGRGFTPFKFSVDSERAREQQPVPMEESSASSKDVVLSREMLNMLMRPDMRKMFFASGLYLVEGETDKLVLSAVRHHLLKDARNTKEKSMDVRELLQAVQVLEMDQWDILALGGCAEAMKAYRAAAALRIPCAIVLDLDAITVKHGKRVEPFCSKTWEKSRMYKELTKERQRNSLEVAETLLDKVQSVFTDTKEDALNETRTILQEHGIWIWKGDLESVVCDNQAAKQQLRTSECFMEALGEDMSVSLSVSGREQMPAKDALKDYDERIFIPMHSFVDELSTALDAARHQRQINPSQIVTDELQRIFGEINKCKQRLIQHDKFCQKGTKRTADWKASEIATSKRPLLDPPLQSHVHHSSEAMLLEDTDPEADGGACSNTAQPGINEGFEKMFWDRVKHKLHEGGWMKFSWETLCEVVEVCLDAKSSPLQDFCRFMKKWQCKGKKKMKPEDLSRSLLSKLFASTEEDTEGK